jgi:hypothetical protein
VKHRPCALVPETRERHAVIRDLSLLSQFPATKWTAVKKPERRQYLKNAYRLLLTWVRQGMVIFVPLGARRDKTRNPGFYEGVYEYLSSMGLDEQ